MLNIYRAIAFNVSHMNKLPIFSLYYIQLIKYSLIPSDIIVKCMYCNLRIYMYIDY